MIGTQRKFVVDICINKYKTKVFPRDILKFWVQLDIYISLWKFSSEDF